MIAWSMGTALAALGGILIAPNVTLDAPSLSLLIVSAYAAAIFGRLRSLPLTFLGAIVLGLLEGYLTGYLPQSPYLTGMRIAAPALLLFAVLLILPNPRLRGRMTRSREYFPLPTVEGRVDLRRRRRVRRRGDDVDDVAGRTSSPTGSCSRSGSSPCRSCRSSATAARSRCAS